MSDAPDPAPDLTADRLALRYLAEAYALGCDARDADVLERCFVEGATLTVHWASREPSTMRFPDGAGHIAASLERYDRTMHFVGNHRAEVHGDDATGVTYCFAHHITGTDDHVMAIRYHDTYVRTDHGWRIAERHLYEDWTEARTVAP
ncbi:MAG: nuclear transport factor 2 family protein [Actinobacteria bacterium]|nr:nuclear transport factor 2 family protein [Actinomycetota bacterium]